MKLAVSGMKVVRLEEVVMMILTEGTTKGTKKVLCIWDSKKMGKNNLMVKHLTCDSNDREDEKWKLQDQHMENNMQKCMCLWLQWLAVTVFDFGRHHKDHCQKSAVVAPASPLLDRTVARDKALQLEVQQHVAMSDFVGDTVTHTTGRTGEEMLTAATADMPPWSDLLFASWGRLELNKTCCHITRFEFDEDRMHRLNHHLHQPTKMQDHHNDHIPIKELDIFTPKNLLDIAKPLLVIGRANSMTHLRSHQDLWQHEQVPNQKRWCHTHTIHHSQPKLSCYRRGCVDCSVWWHCERATHEPWIGAERKKYFWFLTKYSKIACFLNQSLFYKVQEFLADTAGRQLSFLVHPSIFLTDRKITMPRLTAICVDQSYVSSAVSFVWVYNSFFSNDSAGAFTITDNTKVHIPVTMSTNNEE